MYLPPLDFTTDTAATLQFNLAYAQFSSSYVDRLKIDVSKDCGSTWTNKYNKSGSALATAPTTTGSFTPTAAQWRAETIDLTSYAGESQVFIKFVGISGYGNNLYIDDINILPYSTIGVTENKIPSANDVAVYPNPFSSVAFIDISLAENLKLKLTFSILWVKMSFPVWRMTWVPA